MCVEKLNDMKNEREFNSESTITDLEADLSVHCKDLYTHLDNSIKKKLQRRGMTIFQNIYTGFDTEYVNKDTKSNKLLSVQLAVNAKSILKIPLENKYEMSVLDSQKSVSYKINKVINEDGIEVFKYTKMENSINQMIYKCRSIKHKNNDLSISILINGLKRLCEQYSDKVSMKVVNDVVYFSFNRSNI